MARDPLIPIINGLDCTGFVNRNSYQFCRIERMGRNEGTMRSGRIRKDVLAYKIQVSWRLNSLSAAQVFQLMQATAESPVPAIVYDLSALDLRTADFYVTCPALSFALRKRGQLYFQHDAQLVLEEA